MKNLNIYSIYISLLLTGFLSSCSKDFEEINKPADFISSPTLKFELPHLELTLIDNKNAYYGNVYFAPAYAMQITRRQDFSSIIRYSSVMGRHFEWAYQYPMKTAKDMIANAKDPENVNYLSMARILKVYVMNGITDTYGDVPYFDAVKGYTDRIFTPNYDPQKEIYADMLNELNEAALAFDSTKLNPGPADIVYEGDLSKWKKFAYSEMLRLGLRIMDVDPENGKKWIQTAIDGGVMTSNDDSFIVYYLPNVAIGSPENPTSNPLAHLWGSVNKYFVTNTIIDFMKDNNDPRISAYFERNGDGDTAVSSIVGYPPFGYVSFDKSELAVPNRRTFAKFDAPAIHLSYAQVQFELAECVVRKIITGDAQTHYDNGVKAAMGELAVYGPEGIISEAQANAYLQENPFNPSTTEEALDMINTQYWVETYFNWYECWANMRRSGYPDYYDSLDMSIPGNFDAQMPGRLAYPRNEVNGNPSLQDAIKRQGPDEATTLIWWDKK